MLNKPYNIIYCLALAAAAGFTTGKWMVFRKSQAVDEAWSIIAKATVEGRLGTAAKVINSN